jgi:hypothetical protein
MNHIKGAQTPMQMHILLKGAAGGKNSKTRLLSTNITQKAIARLKTINTSPSRKKETKQFTQFKHAWF